jgi:hypothetical protein
MFVPRFSISKMLHASIETLQRNIKQQRLIVMCALSSNGNKHVHGGLADNNKTSSGELKCTAADAPMLF